MIFHEKYQNYELNDFIEDACKISFFFSHMVYWTLNSLTKITTETKTIEYPMFLYLIMVNLFEYFLKNQRKSCLYC